MPVIINGVNAVPAGHAGEISMRVSNKTLILNILSDESRSDKLSFGTPLKRVLENIFGNIVSRLKKMPLFCKSEPGKVSLIFSE